MRTRASPWIPQIRIIEVSAQYQAPSVCIANFSVRMNHLGISPNCRFWSGTPDCSAIHFAPRWCQCCWFPDHSLRGTTLDDNYSQIWKLLLLAHHPFLVSGMGGGVSSVRWESKAKKKDLRTSTGQEYSSKCQSRVIISENKFFFSWSNEFSNCYIISTPEDSRRTVVDQRPCEVIQWRNWFGFV